MKFHAMQIIEEEMKRKWQSNLLYIWTKATGGTRTHDLRFTKASLYRLSYGGETKTHTIRWNMMPPRPDKN